MFESRRDGIGRSMPDAVKLAHTIQRTLLFVAPPGSISECVTEAVEREFTGISVEQINDVESIFAELEHPASLILIDTSFLPEIETRSREIARHHPAAVVALIFDDSWHSPDVLHRILFSKTVRGVLPMNLRLDIWLSVVRLMLRGGEYFPPWVLQVCSEGSPMSVHRSTVVGLDNEPSSTHHAGPASLGYLTERELQILKLVSRGFQNKVIAGKLNLSEHTVKVHLHHIIKKLGTHNRTSAAAIFLRANAALTHAAPLGVG
ncbi:response regulator transcription factor [Allomesorhizobium alhagi]|nr:response regulator transcription factor [Mesorhizobium alhagi]